MSEITNEQLEGVGGGDWTRKQLCATTEQLRTTVANLETVHAAALRIVEDKYIAWGYAGGLNNCPHGYGEGIPCRKCDEATIRGLTVPTCGELSVDQCNDRTQKLLAKIAELEADRRRMQKIQQLVNRSRWAYPIDGLECEPGQDVRAALDAAMSVEQPDAARGKDTNE